MKRKIRVLYLVHDDLMTGGANRSLLDLIQSVKEEIEPVVVTTRKAEIYHYFTKEDIRCLTLPVPQQIQPASEGTLERICKYPLRFLKKAIQKQIFLHGLSKYFPGNGYIDIVHSNTAVVGVGIAAARLLGAYHIWHLREYVDLDHGLKLMGSWRQLRKLILSSDATIAISRSVQDHFLEKPGEFDACIYNAVIPIWKEGKIPISEEREKAFLFVGTLSASKGVETAIRSFIHFHLRYSDWKLYVLGVGKPDYEQFLKNICVKSGCVESVRFEGFCDDPHFYYLRCRAFLMCSRMEALGRTTIEALNAGCIPIGHDAGGTSELIKHGQTGFLYQTDVELLRAMEQIACAPYDDMRRNAHVYAQKHFTPKVYGKAILGLYHRLVKTDNDFENG